MIYYGYGKEYDGDKITPEIGAEDADCWRADKACSLAS